MSNNLGKRASQRMLQLWWDAMRMRMPKRLNWPLSASHTPLRQLYRQCISDSGSSWTDAPAQNTCRTAPRQQANIKVIYLAVD